MRCLLEMKIRRAVLLNVLLLLPLGGVAVFAGFGGLAGCAHRAGERGGCGKDTDCREGRICFRGRCRFTLPGEKCCPCPDGAVSTPSHKKLKLARPKSKHPWPMLGRDYHRSGRTSLPGPSNKPKTAWKVKAKGPISGGVVVDVKGRVYFGSHDGHLYALNSNGGLLWKYKTGDKIWGTPAVNERGDLVVVGSDDDHLYGIETKNGKLRFKVKLGNCSVKESKGTERLKPTKNEDKDSDIRDGQKKAPNAAPDSVRCDIDSSPVFDKAGKIVVGGEGLHILSDRGEVLASYNMGRHVRSSPAFRDDGTYIFGSRDDRVYAVNKTGKVKWSFAARSDVDSTPVLASDGTVYFGSDDGRLYALDPEGEYKWAVLTSEPVRAVPAVGGDGTVYFGSHNGRVYAIDPVSGKARWAFPTTGRIESSPVVDKKQNIYFGSQDGYFYCLNREGNMLWRFKAGSDVDSTAAIAPGGRLYFGSDGGVLFALKSSGAGESGGEAGVR